MTTKKTETYGPPEPPKAKAGDAPSPDTLFQDQLAELEDPVGVAGTNMTAQEAKELVEAGEGDTLAEHGPEEPPVEPPPEDARKAEKTSKRGPFDE